jgi:hypothetical protein
MIIQSVINAGGELNEEALKKYIPEMLENGYVEIQPDFRLINPGDRIKYVGYVRDSEKLAFRSGGWVLTVYKDKDEKRWLAFKSYGFTAFSLQEENTEHIWLLKKKVKEKPQAKIEFKINDNYLDSKYKAFINNELVYCGRDGYSLERFKNSKKYKRAMETNKFKVADY